MSQKSSPSQKPTLMGRVVTEDIRGTAVRIEYKAVKHLHLSVHPPEGRVKAVVPVGTTQEKVRLFIISRLGWVRRKQRAMAEQPRRTPRQYVDGESAFLWGKQYRIRLKQTTGRHYVQPVGEWLEIGVRQGTDRAGRQRTLRRFYREQLRQEIPRIARKWEQKTGLQANEYRVKMMYTKWGSCNVEAGRVWLNLELAKHSPACLSYLLLHELLHLRERGHGPAFQALLSRYLPSWRTIRDTLNSGFPGLPIRE